MKNLIVALFMFVTVQSVHAAALDQQYISGAFDSLYDAKFIATGDLHYADAAGSYATLSAGTNGEVLKLSAGIPSWEADIGFANVMTSLGDTMYGGVSGTPTRLAGNTTTTKKFLSSTGDGNDSAAPVWSTVSASDVGLGNVTNNAQVKVSDFDAKGNILVGTADNTFVALTVGSDGQMLVADQNEASGVKWTAQPSAQAYSKFNKTLIAGDITAGYVDMAVECVANSVQFFVRGGGAMIEDFDYSISVVANKTRITWIGDLATGITALEAGDIVDAKCAY